ncbi:sensor histidine kinase [Halobacteriovorax sp. GFR7]|uniref:sensor histidine kinase n=1 Tax=unclassified Halobacteriovorax TaxID=2639665 RepID=UPI003D9700CF
MSLDIYIHITRYLTIFFMAFFTYQFFSGLVSSYTIKERSSLWYTQMCLFSALYCLFFTINTHVTDIKTSNAILNLLWIFAFIAFYSYMHAIEAFLGKSLKFLKAPKVIIFILTIVQFVSLGSYIFFDNSFIFTSQSLVNESYFYQSSQIAMSPNVFGQIVGSLGALSVFFASAVIWKELEKSNSKEYLLKIGIVLTLISVINDTCLSLEVSGALIPIYYLANAFEAVRFNFFYRKLAFEKLFNLEKEVIRLSKVAQFGFAAASIAHDIKNHIFVIKVKISSLLRNKIEDKERAYEEILKHNDKLLEITDLYMNIFKNNIASNKEDYSSLEIIQDIKELVTPKFEASEVKFEIEADDFIIHCNKTEIVISVVNLIRNALEAVQGHEDKDKWVKLIFKGYDKSIHVVDSGSGIDPSTAKHIFEFGFTHNKESCGHGIGLAITKELLSRSGFNLWLNEKTPNTTFTIDLIE